jgi:hypothetical protein
MKKKNNLPAEAYAKPHTMSGKSVKATMEPGKGPDHSSLQTINMGVGGFTQRPAAEAKTSGIKIRGTGAATKGVMARGPMA